MNEIDRGLYQSLLTESLVQQLQELDVRLPSVDTLFMLRPTESPTLFLQQLGLGLNRSLCLVCGCLREKNRRIGGLMDLGQPHSAALLHWREVRNSLTLVYPFPL